MILMYHKIYPTSLSPWWVDIDNFYRQLVELKSYKVVSLDDYNPKRSDHVVITFDDGYQNVLDFAAPLLNNFSYPFEVFINGSFTGKYNIFDKNIEPKTKMLSSEGLKKIIKLGGRLQWHTNHHIKLDEVANPNIIKREFTIPENLKMIDKKGFKYLSYPHGVFNKFVLDIAKTMFTGALSCVQGDDSNPFCLNRIMVNNETSIKKNRIAVIISSYNYGNYLCEAIESVLAQTIPVDEIIIMDDCSTDNTREIGKVYQTKFPTLIKYVRNKENLGIIESHNKALNLTTCEYVCILDADNYFLSNYIEETSTVLNSNQNVGIAYSDFALFGSRSRIKYELFPIEMRKSIKAGQYYIINFPEFSEESKELQKSRNIFHGNSLYRKSAFIQAGGYKFDKKRPEDHSLFYRIVKKGWLAKKVSNTLLCYRQHSKNQENDKFNYFAELDFYKKHYREAQKKISSYKHLELEMQKIKSSLSWSLIYVKNNPRKGIPLFLNRVLMRGGLKE